MRVPPLDLRLRGRAVGRKQNRAGNEPAQSDVSSALCLLLDGSLMRLLTDASCSLPMTTACQPRRTRVAPRRKGSPIAAPPGSPGVSHEPRIPGGRSWEHDAGTEKKYSVPASNCGRVPTVAGAGQPTIGVFDDRGRMRASRQRSDKASSPETAFASTSWFRPGDALPLLSILHRRTPADKRAVRAATASSAAMLGSSVARVSFVALANCASPARPVAPHCPSICRGATDPIEGRLQFRVSASRSAALFTAAAA